MIQKSNIEKWDHSIIDLLCSLSEYLESDEGWIAQQNRVSSINAIGRNELSLYYNLLLIYF